MKFGMIGAGTVSRAIAGAVVDAGHEVVFSNSRGPETLGDVVSAFGPLASAGTVAEAGDADIVVLTVDWERVRDALDALPRREGRILVDATNQWADPPPAFIVDHLDLGGSEWVASQVPGTHVIKAFSHMYAPKLADDPIADGGRRILFYAGDDQTCKERFRSAVESLGYAPIDLGPLRMGRLMQVDGPLTGLHAIRENVPHPVPETTDEVPGPSQLAAGSWTIEPAHSSISFSIRHLMVSRVRGTFRTFNGAITVSPDHTSAVAVTIDVGSICTGNDDRDAHLRSQEFFDVEHFPTATFTSTGVRRDRKGGYVLDGALTLKGKTQRIDLGLEFNGVNTGMRAGTVAGFQGTIVLKRTDFDIGTGLSSKPGGAILGEQVALTLEIEAVPTAPSVGDPQSVSGHA